MTRSKISGAHFLREPRRIAVPGDAAVIEHIDAVGVGQREGHILLGEQKRQRVLFAQPLDRFGQKTEDHRREAQCRLVE
jgi:hypothetical protein